MATVSVRYIVDDVDAAIAFYCRYLDFHEQMHPAPTFAMLSRGDLRLVLSAPSGQGGGGQSMPDGTKPQPGGWNRFSLEVADLDGIVEVLRKEGVHFRNDIVTGVGGKQVLIEDPFFGLLADPSQPLIERPSARHVGDTQGDQADPVAPLPQVTSLRDDELETWRAPNCRRQAHGSSCPSRPLYRRPRRIPNRDAIALRGPSRRRNR